ncbi:hypothetical protein pipiens_005105 [Culex pipiens pipiens]|uniref:Uncharacterized protein n=1 Tax=Culex pipiens pipiens TaxID=38569 RepID=A0ABD1CBF4_CULPP
MFKSLLLLSAVVFITVEPAKLGGSSYRTDILHEVPVKHHEIGGVIKSNGIKELKKPHHLGEKLHLVDEQGHVGHHVGQSYSKLKKYN